MKSQAGRIVVAYDGSEPAGAALDWAASEAQRSGRPLTVLHFADYWSLVPGSAVLAPWAGLDADRIDRVAREGADRAGRIATSVEIQALTQTARVVPALIAISQHAELIVLGTRGRGALAGSVLGSVAFAVTAHARCPVVVVRGDSTLALGPECPVVVGVDGSTGAESALRFAAGTAARAQAPLIVLSVYRPQSPNFANPPYRESGIEAGDGPSEAQRAATKVATKVATDAAYQAQQLHSQLDIRIQTLIGTTVGQLCTIAHRAGLLVVGSRGRGGFVGLVLGSVTQGVIHDSPCPVAVVPGSPTSPRTPVDGSTAGVRRGAD